MILEVLQVIQLIIFNSGNIKGISLNNIRSTSGNPIIYLFIFYIKLI